MYLAPFNYDRFFERVFRHTHIAKAFLEDMLDVTIEEIEPLPRKNKITDDAAFVEFDFRCKIDGKYVIIDMQQWYKRNVVKRFYLYFCNNTSLQLENLKTVSVVPTETSTSSKEIKEYKTKKYEDLEPAITFIWMANDTLGFKDEIIAFTVLPEILRDFINDKELWQNLNIDELLAYRKKVLDICNNKTKDLDFLSKNRMIYALQPTIVKNHRLGKSEMLDKCVRWFEFAEKTRNDKNTAEDFKIFKNEPIIMEVIELLKTSELSDDDFQYITDYTDIEEKIAYERQQRQKDAIDDLRIELHDIVWEEVKGEVRKEVREEVIAELSKDFKRLENDKLKAEEDKLKAEKSLLKSIEKSLKNGDSFDEIADYLELDSDTLQKYIKLITGK